MCLHLRGGPGRGEPRSTAIARQRYASTGTRRGFFGAVQSTCTIHSSLLTSLVFWWLDDSLFDEFIPVPSERQPAVKVDCRFFEFLTAMLSPPSPGADQSQKESTDACPLRCSMVVVSDVRPTARGRGGYDVGLARRSLAKTSKLFARLTFGHPRRHEGESSRR